MNLGAETVWEVPNSQEFVHIFIYPAYDKEWLPLRE